MSHQGFDTIRDSITAKIYMQFHNVRATSGIKLELFRSFYCRVTQPADVVDALQKSI